MVARTYLFVPGDRPERVEKALASDAEAVVIDLEDAVAHERKSQARETIAQLRSSSKKPVLVRCHPVGTPEFEDDLGCLRAVLPMLCAVMLAKCQNGREVELLEKSLPGVSIVPLLETVAGVAALPEIARLPCVERVAFGSVDYANDLGVQWSSEGLERRHAMGSLVFQSRLHDLNPPVDAVFPVLDDPEGLARDIQVGKQMGFFGKLIIHPRQIDPVHRIYAASKEEHAWARKVVETYQAAGNQGAVQVDGQLVDQAVYQRALRCLQLPEAEARDP